jgi:exopolyphosphatase/guanosine-5'-triphosphate,3'-diphosphate pyrophosphatase
LSGFKKICDNFGVELIHTYGTSAIRDAKNQSEFLKQVLDSTGIIITVMSGREEAHLIHQGIQYSHKFSKDSIIMDIGGGSTEFILANASGVIDLVSLNIGISRIFQFFTFNDPMTDSDIEVVENYLEQNSEGFFNNKRCDLLIGASGSFETFYELIYKKPFSKLYKTHSLDFTLMLELLDTIIYSTRAERDINPFIIPMRKKMAPLAAIKTRWVIRKMNIKEIIVSPCSLKEGGLLI